MIGPVLQAARMRDRKRGPGRPSFGVTEASITFRAPRELVEKMAEKAEREGISASEAWRRAAQEWLGIKPLEYTKHLDGKS